MKTDILPKAEQTLQQMRLLLLPSTSHLRQSKGIEKHFLSHV